MAPNHCVTHLVQGSSDLLLPALIQQLPPLEIPLLQIPCGLLLPPSPLLLLLQLDLHLLPLSELLLRTLLQHLLLPLPGGHLLGLPLPLPDRRLEGLPLLLDLAPTLVPEPLLLLQAQDVLLSQALRLLQPAHALQHSDGRGHLRIMS